MGGSKAASGRWLKDSSFSLSRQGFLSLFTLQLSPVVHAIASSLQPDDFGRYLFNSPIKGTMEGSQLLMAGVALLCWGYTQATRSHISVDIVVVRYPARVRAITGFASLILTTVVFGLIAWQSALISAETLEQQRMLGNLPLPLFPFKLMVPVGASILCLESIIQIIRHFPDMKKGEEARR